MARILLISIPAVIIAVLWYYILYQSCYPSVNAECEQYDIYESRITSHFQLNHFCTRCASYYKKCDDNGKCENQCLYYQDYICYDTYYQETYNEFVTHNVRVGSNEDDSYYGYNKAIRFHPVGRKGKIYVNKFSQRVQNEQEFQEGTTIGFILLFMFGAFYVMMLLVHFSII